MLTSELSKRLNALQNNKVLATLTPGDVMRMLPGLQEFKYIKSIWFSQGRDLAVLGNALIEYWNTDAVKNEFKQFPALMFGKNKKTGVLEIKGYTNANTPEFNQFYSEIVFADEASKHPNETLNELKQYFKEVRR